MVVLYKIIEQTCLFKGTLRVTFHKKASMITEYLWLNNIDSL